MPCSFVNEISYSLIQNLIFTEDVKHVDFPVEHLQNLIKRDLFNFSLVCYYLSLLLKVILISIYSTIVLNIFHSSYKTIWQINICGGLVVVGLVEMDLKN